MPFVRKWTDRDTEVLSEKSQGGPRTGGGTLPPRVWGEVCPSSVLSRPGPRAFGIRETLVCPASGRALLPVALACGPALPAARPCSCGVARPGCLLLLLQTAGGGHWPRGPTNASHPFGLGDPRVLAVRSGWPLGSPSCEHAPRWSAPVLCSVESAHTRWVRTGLRVPPSKPRCPPLTCKAPAWFPGVERDGANAGLVACVFSSQQ